MKLFKVMFCVAYDDEVFCEVEVANNIEEIEIKYSDDSCYCGVFIDEVKMDDYEVQIIKKK